MLVLVTFAAACQLFGEKYGGWGVGAVEESIVSWCQVPSAWATAKRLSGQKNEIGSMADIE